MFTKYTSGIKANILAFSPNLYQWPNSIIRFSPLLLISKASFLGTLSYCLMWLTENNLYNNKNKQTS